MLRPGAAGGKTAFTASGSLVNTTSVFGPEAYGERVAVAAPAARHEALGVGYPCRVWAKAPLGPGGSSRAKRGSTREGRGSSRRSCPLRRSGVPRSLARRSCCRRSFVKPAIPCQFAGPEAPRQRVRAVCQPFAPQMTHSLDDATALRPLDDGAWEGTIEDGWYAGLGPLGGYVMAIVLRGLLLATADEARAPRTLTMHFLRAPASGPIVVRPVVERAGRSLSTLSARLEQGGELVGLALAAVSAPRAGPVISESPMPEAAPPSAREVPPEDRGPTLSPPPFTGRVTMESRFGAPPFSGADSSEVGGWMGLREERPIDALTVALLADAWYPAPGPGCASSPRRRRSSSPCTSAPRSRCPTRCCSAASARGRCARASSTRTASCGRRTGRSSPLAPARAAARRRALRPRPSINSSHCSRRTAGIEGGAKVGGGRVPILEVG